MEPGIDANTPLDYVEFNILPSQNRYETCVCYENKKERVTSGLLEHLLLHSSGIKALHSKGSNATYKLCPSENPDDIKWFTKSTLIRFLHVIGSTNILDITNSLKNEISQLEEASRFHLSLYAKGKEYQLQSEESDASCTNGIGSTTKAADMDASKLPTLHALDLRLNALRVREELTTACDQASGSRYSVDEMTDVEKFSQHFGSRDLSDSLQKHIELRHGAQAIENSSCKDFSESDGVKSNERNNHTSRPALSETPAKYGVSPAKAAQAERQSSTESDESSLSSEEEQPSAQERFRNIRLQEEYDTHDPKGNCSLSLPFLKKRSKIIEIVAARDIVFALAQSGVCAAFSRETNERICFLNVCPDEVIRSLFYNKNNDSLITVSVYASDNFSSLKCRTTRIEYIRRGKPDAGFPLFETESLKWPGFVEFDDVNGKVLTYSAQDSIYKVFDLKNYTMLYSISDINVQEIKISLGIMLLIFTKTQDAVPLKILSIEDGTVLKSFNHLLHRNKKVDFIEQFNEKLLVKQENENLQIVDIRNFEITEVSRTEFMTPSAFIFLNENQLFLTFKNRTVSVWNSRGERMTSFEDHLWHPDCNTNNIYITRDQDLIISYCRADTEEPLSDGNAGSINISNILSGKCLAQIKASNSIPVKALENITALFYDEDRNEIYTGNRHGLVHVWSN